MVLPTEATSGKNFGYQGSVTGTTATIQVFKEGVSVQSYSSVSDANVQLALQYLYTNGNNSEDYVLFIGSNVTLSAATMANTAASGTFSGLANKVKSLTIVGNTNDSLSSTPNVAATGSITITTPTNNYFGVPTVFRNVNVSAANDNFYANGNAIAFMPGSNFTYTGIKVFGGTDGTSNVTGDTNIYVASTGTGTMSFYGGNDAGGNISGSTHLSIVNASGLTTVTGGNATGGTINGDTNVSVTQFTGNAGDYYGGGVGTSASPVTVNGNVYNNWNSTNSGAVYNGDYYGGGSYATIKGKIYNNFDGLGSYSGTRIFNGGVLEGTIGSSSSLNSDEIINSYDTSKFKSGMASFAGISGAASGVGSSTKKIVTYGNIVNYVKTGYNSGSAYMGGVAGAYGASFSNSQGMPASGTSVDSNPAAAATSAEAAAYVKLYGNTYTWAKGGLIGAGQDYNIVLGGGYGFIKGNSIIEIGDGSTAPGGNTTGENNVSDGSRSSSNRLGIGGTGLVVVGDSGDGALAATESANNVLYDITKTNLANSYYLNDIVGGGGNAGGNGTNYFQVGDSYLIQNNSAARWTYGANWSGNQIGNSYNFNNGSVTDTLEGGSYGPAGCTYGNTTTQVNNGQTDWFVSGGAWDGRYISGNMTTVVNNGVIPANTGGNYALSGNNITVGNSSVYIYGGDFSGAPRQDGPKTVAGGNFVSGGSIIYGDSSLTLDLSGPNGSTFKFPTSASYLSAGPGYNKTGIQSGTDASNTINLTIKANAATGSQLANATIYGDGSSSTNVKAGTINITIDAPGATVGNVYASNSNLVSSKGLSRNVVTKIGEGTTIGGNLFNSSAGDDLTSTYANAGTNTSTVLFGDGSGNTNDPITITGKVSNFSSAEVSPGVKTTVSGGLLNGKGATAANHAATYSKSGNLTLGDNSTLAVSATTSIISAGQLKVGKNVQLSSPYINTAGLMNFSDLKMTSTDSGLSWIPTGTAIAPTTTYSGAYWGSQKGYPVLTFNGGDATTGSGAFNITPANFQGVDSDKNYAFLGDYSLSSVATPSNPTWIGYVVPGQIRVFNTTNLNGSTGKWKQNIPGVTTGTPTPGTAMKIWSSVAANTASSEIVLKYVMDYTPDLSSVTDGKPFTFAADSPGYIKSQVATAYSGTVLNSYPAVNPNFDINAGTSGATRNLATKDYFTGNQQNGTNDQTTFGSYIIQNIVTDNTTSLSSGNYILPNTGSGTNASNLTDAQLQKILNLKGVGVLSDLSVSNGTLSQINTAGQTVTSPTSAATNGSGKSYAQIPMTWTLGSSTSQSNVVVVPQSAVIATDNQSAVNAFDAGMTGDDAHALVDQSSLDNNWTYALGFKADGTVASPTITTPANLISTLQTITSSSSILDANGNISPVTYSYQGVTKNVTLNISFGSISLTTPTNYNFGSLDVSPKSLVAWPQGSSSDVVVSDTRTGSGLKPWYVTVAQTQDLQGITNGNNLAPYLIFNNGTGNVQVSSAALQIYSNTNPTTGTFTLNSTWNATTGKGIHLNIPVQSQEKGTYQGTLTWALSDVPTN